MCKKMIFRLSVFIKVPELSYKSNVVLLMFVSYGRTFLVHFDFISTSLNDRYKCFYCA
jgi:hypothetical protein